MKKNLFIILTALVAIALLVWTFMPRATEVELASVTRGRFERAVQADGKTRLRQRYMVSTPPWQDEWRASPCKKATRCKRARCWQP